jgi:hypothetical protein
LKENFPVLPFLSSNFPAMITPLAMILMLRNLGFFAASTNRSAQHKPIPGLGKGLSPKSRDLIKGFLRRIVSLFPGNKSENAPEHQ